MKTLKELNSKWYWRLVKVLWCIFGGFIVVIAGFIAYDNVLIYNPDKIEEAEVSVKSIGAFDAVERIKRIFPEENINLYDLPKMLKTPGAIIDKPEELAAILVAAEFVNKKIDKVGVCGREIKLGCSGNPVGTYIQDAIADKNGTRYITISNNTYSTMKSGFDKSYNISESALKSLEKIKSGESSWESFYDYENVTGKKLSDIIGYRNYLGFSGYFYITLTILGTLIGFVLISSLIKRLVYYVILGEFKPKL